jgi:hypothetical protein
VKVKLELRGFEDHPKALQLIQTSAKRTIVKAGRRGGKTVALARLAIERFLKGQRVLYGVPTGDQLDRFWYEVTTSLAPLIETKEFKKDETEHFIERVGTEQRLRAKTAYNADTWRGGKWDLLIYDEWQLMNEDAWGVVGAPMLMDTGGDAVFSYTPPRLRAPSRSNVISKARDPGHAALMFRAALAEMEAAKKENRPSRWLAISWTSKQNPFLTDEGLDNATFDMTSLDYAREILVDEAADDEGSFKQEWLRFYSYKPSDPTKPIDDPSNFLLIAHHVPEKAHPNEPDEEQPEDIFAGSLDLRVILDPNHAGKNGRCKHAISVVGFDAATLKFYLLDEWAESVGYRDMGEKLFEMCGPEKWNQQEVWIEAVASQVYCALYLSELNARLPANRRIRFNELPKDNRANAKDRRIEGLEPYFKNRQFWIHREKCKQFKAEYSSYYRGKMVDVDLLDTIGYAPQLFNLTSKRQVMREIQRRQEQWTQREAGVTGY